MALSDSISPRGTQSEFNFDDGFLRGDFPVEDEYIDDDYDSEPLLNSHTDFELSRQFRGRRYSRLNPDEEETNTIIPIKWRSRRCVMRTLIVFVLCGLGTVCGYFISTQNIRECKATVSSREDLDSLHGPFINRISSRNIKESSR